MKHDNSVKDVEGSGNRPGPMSRQERRAVISLASIFSLRLFGLFMLLPVLAIYAADFSDGTPAMIGMALGAYGATQALLQIPFGLLSDRLGRKPIIIAGLLIFAVGSVIAALADSVAGVIIGRAIQGAGAISSAVLALTADLTREEQRTKSMAVIGMSIGFVFLLSLIVSPPLQHLIGVDGLFWMTAILALAAILVLLFAVPTPHTTILHRDVQPVSGQILQVLRDRSLLRLDVGIFILHLLLTALFVVLPELLQQKSGLSVEEHWKFYLPVLLLSVIGMLPFVLLGSVQKKVTLAYRLAIALLFIALVFISASIQGQMMWLLLALVFYFSAFNALESMLPSLVSRVAPAAAKGTAIGVYNSAQFLGVFFGGVIGGMVSGRYGVEWMLLCCAMLALIWLILALCAGSFKLAESRVISIGHRQKAELQGLIERMREVPGVEDVTIIAGESLAYLKVDSESYNNDDLIKSLN